jgi:6-phosphogluconolactonase
MSERWIEVEGTAGLREAACGRVLGAAARALRDRGSMVIVLAGGSTPQEVYRTLRGAATDWPRWHVWFGDERCAPRDDALRNSRMASDAWLDHVPIPRVQIHEIPAELGPVDGARAYREMLHAIGDFDLVLLGLGEDGHTASLFPGHDWGAAKDAPDALAVTGAPKPPPERVSLSANRLGRAREVLFLVEGESKRDAVARWRAQADIPARAIRPRAGVDVLVDSRLLRAR